MDAFHERQKRMFEIVADRFLKDLDRETGLVRGEPPAHFAGSEPRPGGYDLRDSVYLATALAYTNRQPLAWEILPRILDHQDCRPESFTRGNFFWFTNRDIVADTNAVSFLAPHLADLYRAFAEVMPSTLRDRLAEALALAVDGLNAQRTAWSYTNIAMLNMAAKLTIGDALTDARATNLAYWDWEEWRNGTGRIGMVNEYNSLTYSFVQLDALAMMLACDVRIDFLAEVRAAFRHLLTSIVVDFHPAVGRVTGPQSRSGPPNRRLRSHSLIQNIFHLMWGLPIPDEAIRLWVGVPIGPEDILPEARDLPLPRTTVARTHGFTRTNHLAADFALGSIDGKADWIGHELPFFLAYRTSHQRCSVPVMVAPAAAGHHACQRAGTLLAACTWLFDTAPYQAGAGDDELAKYTGLKTGRPDNWIRDPNRSATFTVELGLRDQVRIVEAPGAALGVETESVRVFLRFFDSGANPPELSLADEPDGEVVLTVELAREGRSVSPRELMTMGGLLLHVEPVGESDDLESFMGGWLQKSVQIDVTDDGWRLSLDDAHLDVPAEVPLFYSTEGIAVTPNLWAASMFDR